MCRSTSLPLVSGRHSAGHSTALPRCAAGSPDRGLPAADLGSHFISTTAGVRT